MKPVVHPDVSQFPTGLKSENDKLEQNLYNKYVWELVVTLTCDIHKTSYPEVSKFI